MRLGTIYKEANTVYFVADSNKALLAIVIVIVLMSRDVTRAQKDVILDTKYLSSIPLAMALFNALAKATIPTIGMEFNLKEYQCQGCNISILVLVLV